MSRLLALSAALAMASSCSCNVKPRTLENAELFAEPSKLDFGTVFLGYPRTLSFSVHSASRTRADVTVLAPAGVTVSPEAATVEAGGMVEFKATWNPTTAAPLNALILISTPTEPLGVAVSGQSKVPLNCAPSGVCVSSVFSPTTGRCVEAPLADGTSCTLSNACFEGGACLHGACLGNSRNCDDHDACTTDACDTQTGCVHLAKACPVPVDPCQVPVCDPVMGCSTAPVADGTACGANDCKTAQVCLAGACKTVVPPEGSTCLAASPCQGEGHCAGQVCTAPARTALKEVFAYELGGMRSDDADVRPLLDATGNLYWMEYVPAGVDPVLSECRLRSKTRDGVDRFSTTILSCESSVTFQALAGGRVVLVNGGHIYFFNAASGVAEGRAPLKSTPLPYDDSKHVFVPQALLIDGTGLAKVVVRLVPSGQSTQGAGSSAFGGDAAPPPPPQAHTLVLTFDPVARVQTQRVSLRDGFTRAVLDAQNNLFLGFTNPFASISVSAAGVMRWNLNFAAPAPATDPAPMGVNGGSLLLHDGQVLSTLTHQVVSPATTPPPNDFSAVMGSGYQAFMGRLQTGRTSLSFFASGLPWTSASVPMGVLGTSHLALAEGDVVLVASSEFISANAEDAKDSLIIPPTQWVLNAVDSRGVTRWSCPIPGTAEDPTANQALRNIRLSAVALSDGRWTVQMNANCTTCLKDPMPRLRTFDLGPVKAAAHGWVGISGSPGRTGRPLQ